jgi:hypothetical protein
MTLTRIAFLISAGSFIAMQSVTPACAVGSVNIHYGQFGGHKQHKLDLAKYPSKKRFAVLRITEGRAIERLQRLLAKHEIYYTETAGSGFTAFFAAEPDYKRAIRLLRNNHLKYPK